MRIIGGLFKGRRLKEFQSPHIRPTMDRVKETVFNILMNDMEGARVLDLFTGTGNLSCEALSRGAQSVECVELSKKSIQIMKQNFRDLQVEPQVHVVAQDVLSYLKKYRGEPFDVILCDPPFTEKMGHEVMTALAVSAVVGPQTLIMIEYSRHERMDEAYASLFRYTERKFGDKNVSFFRQKQEA
jgi:16S rRNA (guanine966-N2)-methyltransferase